MSNDTKRSLERIFHHMALHPYLCVVGMCVMLFFFGFCQQSGIVTESYVYAAVLAAVIAALFVLIGRIGDSIRSAAVIYGVTMAVIGVCLFLVSCFEGSPSLILWLSLILIAATAALMRAEDALSTRSLIMLMIAAGVILRYVYCLYTDSGERQHDVGYFNWTWGHANYIEYWFNNGLKLPDFDVRSIWQYYHPPLHHWLMALLLRIFTLFGMEYEPACQALQVLPFIWSSLIMAVSYRVFRWVKLKGTPLVIAMAIVCFHPTFLLMGGFFNNDTLTTLFMMLSIMFALRWYREPTLRRIIPIALCIGLGMMTKLSAWMVATAVAVIFLYVLIKNIRSWAKFIGQFAVFGAICAPLGLWWQVRNLILFQVPLTFVPYLSEQSSQYLGDMTAAERLFGFGGGQLSYVFFAYSDPNFGAPYDDFNPTLGLIKSALFGEGQNGISDVHFPEIAVTGRILFWVGAVLAILCFAAFIVMMFSRRSGLDGMSRVFFGVLALTMLGSYYLFCFSFPFTCTMNVRYCAPLIPLFAMGLGLMLRRCSGGSLAQKILRYGSYALTAAFCLMTCVLYSQLATLNA